MGGGERERIGCTKDSQTNTLLLPLNTATETEKRREKRKMKDEGQ